MISRNIGLNAADADRRFDVERNEVFVVRNPDRELRSVRKRVPFGGADLTGELQGAERTHTADFLGFTPQKAVPQMADRIFEEHFEHLRFTFLERCRVDAPQVEIERHGIHAARGERHRFGRIAHHAASLPPGVYRHFGPVVHVVAPEPVVAFADIAFETACLQLLAIDQNRIFVVHVHYPAEGGERFAVCHDAVHRLSFIFFFDGGHAYASHFGIGKEFGLVAGPVIEYFARLIELGASRQGCQEKQDGEKNLFFH